MTENRDISSLQDILQSAIYIAAFIQNRDFESFQHDVMCSSAIIRQLEIIGEAANRVSQTYRDSHPDIPWRNIIGMRNILIHAYHDIALEEVWQAATTSVPELARQIEPLV